jgi:translation elongation factor EF-1beta
MAKTAVITIELVPEADGIESENLKKQIKKSLQCDWLLKTSKIEL